MTIRVRVIVRGVCLDRTFDNSAIALAYLDRLQLFDFELVPVMPTSDLPDLARIAFLMIDKNPGLTLEEFTDYMLETFNKEEFTKSSFQLLFEQAQTFHSRLYMNRKNLPLPELAFLVFKENGYDWVKACHELQKTRGIGKSEAFNAIQSAGLV